VVQALRLLPAIRALAHDENNVRTALTGHLVRDESGGELRVDDLGRNASQLDENRLKRLVRGMDGICCI
jgi:hypothetical protein